jgi:hypothetical protein
MATTKTITVYQFNELSDFAKKTAINKLSDINVNFDWWDSVYEDAKTVGIKITSFGLDRNRSAEGEFLDSPSYTAYKILAEHGETCETYKTAKEYLSEYNYLVEKYSDGVNKHRVSEDNEQAFDDEANDLDGDFLKSIVEDYAIMLQKEYEYLCSDAAIIEAIEANEYEFTINGTLWR